MSSDLELKSDENHSKELVDHLLAYQAILDSLLLSDDTLLNEERTEDEFAKMFRLLNIFKEMFKQLYNDFDFSIGAKIAQLMAEKPLLENKKNTFFDKTLDKVKAQLIQHIQALVQQQPSDEDKKELIRTLHNKKLKSAIANLKKEKAKTQHHAKRQTIRFLVRIEQVLDDRGHPNQALINDLYNSIKLINTFFPRLKIKLDLFTTEHYLVDGITAAISNFMKSKAWVFHYHAIMALHQVGHKVNRVIVSEDLSCADFIEQYRLGELYKYHILPDEKDIIAALEQPTLEQLSDQTPSVLVNNLKNKTREYVELSSTARNNTFECIMREEGERSTLNIVISNRSLDISQAESVNMKTISVQEQQTSFLLSILNCIDFDSVEKKLISFILEFIQWPGQEATFQDTLNNLIRCYLKHQCLAQIYTSLLADRSKEKKTVRASVDMPFFETELPEDIKRIHLLVEHVDSIYTKHQEQLNSQPVKILIYQVKHACVFLNQHLKTIYAAFNESLQAGGESIFIATAAQGGLSLDKQEDSVQKINKPLQFFNKVFELLQRFNKVLDKKKPNLDKLEEKNVESHQDQVAQFKDLVLLIEDRACKGTYHLFEEILQSWEKLKTKVVKGEIISIKEEEIKEESKKLTTKEDEIKNKIEKLRITADDYRKPIEFLDKLLTAFRKLKPESENIKLELSSVSEYTLTFKINAILKYLGPKMRKSGIDNFVSILEKHIKQLKADLVLIINEPFHILKAKAQDFFEAHDSEEKSVSALNQRSQRGEVIGLLCRDYKRTLEHFKEDLNLVVIEKNHIGFLEETINDLEIKLKSIRDTILVCMPLIKKNKENIEITIIPFNQDFKEVVFLINEDVILKPKLIGVLSEFFDFLRQKFPNICIEIALMVKDLINDISNEILEALKDASLNIHLLINHQGVYDASKNEQGNYDFTMSMKYTHANRDSMRKVNNSINTGSYVVVDEKQVSANNIQAHFGKKYCLVMSGDENVLKDADPFGMQTLLVTSDNRHIKTLCQCFKIAYFDFFMELMEQYRRPVSSESVQLHSYPRFKNTESEVRENTIFESMTLRVIKAQVELLDIDEDIIRTGYAFSFTEICRKYGDSIKNYLIFSNKKNCDLSPTDKDKSSSLSSEDKLILFEETISLKNISFLKMEGMIEQFKKSPGLCVNRKFIDKLVIYIKYLHQLVNFYSQFAFELEAVSPNLLMSDCFRLTHFVEESIPESEDRCYGHDEKHVRSALRGMLKDMYEGETMVTYPILHPIITAHLAKLEKKHEALVKAQPSEQKQLRKRSRLGIFAR